ncbi:hypothetical protein ATN83_3393 [Raoultella ornithinolytica]|jgi:hypothetical protein|nr:hypothetical protein ATN83_3393 [Raoultella ornithinolytica]KDV93440.1 hypothetical protein AB00_2735 [Raoultella ornithinolytica 2-156-04_S1_C1]KDX13776.1 hypothetical protein AB28_2920 [Raoultella ornithinolytica 2-156-04_S1_C2]
MDKWPPIAWPERIKTQRNGNDNENNSHKIKTVKNIAPHRFLI